MKNIHILTNNCSISNLVVIGDKLTLIRSNYYSKRYIELHGYQSKAIYITSDKDLVLGGYHFNSKYGDAPQKTNQRDIDSRKYWEEEDYYITKIILTTDQDLINDGIQAIDDDFLEWFVKNPSCEFAETELLDVSEVLWEEYFKKHGVYPKYPYYEKIIIPKEELNLEIFKTRRMQGASTVSKLLEEAINLIKKEEPKQETLEEASRKYLKNCKESIHDNIMFLQGSNFGAKWQQEQEKNKFSKEDLEQAFKNGFIISYGIQDVNSIDKKDDYFKEWFEQFKKK